MEAHEDELVAALKKGEEYRRRVDPILGFRLNPSLLSSFEFFLSILNDGVKRDALSAWSGSQRWYGMISGVNSNVKESLTISAYHASRISTLNSAVVSALRDFPLAPNEGVGGGDMLVLTAEYQAFILSCRRCLDQLAWAISGLFKNECSSFRELGTYLSRQKKRAEHSNALLEVYLKHRGNFDGWLLTQGDQTSLRDLLAHRKSITVGTLNVRSSGVVFVGFDSPIPGFRGRQISEIVEELFWNLHGCVCEFVELSGKILDDIVARGRS